MKKIFSIFAMVLLFSSATIFAQEAENNEIEAATHFIDFNLLLLAPGDINSSHVKAQLEYQQLVFNSASLYLGTQVSNSRFDVAENLLFSPQLLSFTIKRTLFRINFGETISYRYLYGTSHQINFSPEILFSFINPKGGCVGVTLLYNLQLTAIPSLSDEKPLLLTNNFDFSIDMFKTYANGLTLKGKIASYDTFTHNKFLAPIFGIGASYDITPRYNAGFMLSLRYIDFFTQSGYIESVEFKFNFGVYL